MLEVWCQGVDLTLQPGHTTLPTSVEVELDGFVIGRTSKHPASRRPRWEDGFPVASNGRSLSFRLLACGPGDEDITGLGECQVNLQALLAQQPEGQTSVALLSRAGCVGTLWFAFRALRSSSRSPTAQGLVEKTQTSSSRSPQAVKAGGIGCFGGLGVGAGSPGAATACGGFGFGFRRGSGSSESGQAPVQRPSVPMVNIGCGSRGVEYRKAQSEPSASAGASPASPLEAASFGTSPRKSNTGWLAGPEKSAPDRTPGGSRLTITDKAREDLQEVMRSKDKLRYLAERPFKARGLQAGGRLDFSDFQQALKELLQELHMSVPATRQMKALFDKHNGGTEGVSSEDFEALLFRLLCFLRASEEVQIAPVSRTVPEPEARDKRWREEFIQKNRRKFSDVYEVRSQLGKGSFGTVYLVEHRTQKDRLDVQRVRVCKMIQKSKAKEAKTPEAKVREEFAVLKQLDHPNVLRIFEDFEDEDNFYLIMEQCRGGDLAGYVKCLEPMDARTYELWVAKVMQHTLSAVAYCHSKAVIHKDLKPENVMLSSPRDAPLQDLHVVVVDFGLAEVFANPTDRSEVVSGTPPYMAPEVWQGNFSKSCDVWSAGCMLFFLLSGRLPFVAATVKEFPKAVMLEPEWAAMGGASQDAQNICRQMLQKVEHSRPTARTCLRDRWFVNVGLAGSTDPVRALGKDQIDSLFAVGERSEFEKFVTRFVATQIDASGQQSVNEAFRAFDADGDGLLSREELRQGLLQFGASPKHVDQVVDELDVTRTGKISYTEFLAGIINLRSKKPEEQDKLLWIAWEQFRPDAQGQVKVSSIQDALATRGMTVADMPDGFLAALNRESSGFITFDTFKQVLLADGSGEVVRTLVEEKHRGGRLMRWLMNRF